MQPGVDAPWAHECALEVSPTRGRAAGSDTGRGSCEQFTHHCHVCSVVSVTTLSALAVTAEELDHLPPGVGRCELVEGEVRVVPPAGFDHGQVALAVGSLLRVHVKQHGLGEVVAAGTGFRLARAPDTVRAGDAAFVAAERLPPRQERSRFLDLAPDLIVEVVSPSDRASEVVEKALGWLDTGVRLVWVVYPEQRLVAVHEADASVVHRRLGEDLLGGSVMPGLVLAVAELFD